MHHTVASHLAKLWLPEVQLFVRIVDLDLTEVGYGRIRAERLGKLLLMVLLQLRCLLNELITFIIHGSLIAVSWICDGSDCLACRSHVVLDDLVILFQELVDSRDNRG